MRGKFRRRRTRRRNSPPRLDTPTLHRPDRAYATRSSNLVEVWYRILAPREGVHEGERSFEKHEVRYLKKKEPKVRTTKR